VPIGQGLGATLQLLKETQIFGRESRENISSLKNERRPFSLVLGWGLLKRVVLVRLGNERAF
jgi:hypothetical protein